MCLWAGKAKKTWAGKGLAGIDVAHDIPDGVIAHLTTEFGGKAHDWGSVEIACESCEMESHRANRHSGGYENDSSRAGKELPHLEENSHFHSASRPRRDMPNTLNNWLCYDFKERRIVPIHCAIGSSYDAPGDAHLTSWPGETRVDDQNWREVGHTQSNWQLNGRCFVGTFAIAGGKAFRLIGLLNIGGSHVWNDCLCISVRGILAVLIE